jgi:cardiolipin synthase (CMP-forming)
MFDRVWTIPNAVSFARLLAIPYFWYVLLGQNRIGLAALLIFGIGSTDWLDGFLARRLSQESEFGAFLDPLADRLMIGSALIAGLIAGVLPPIIGWPLLAREAVVGVGAAIVASRGGGRLEVRYLGKLATFIIYGAIPSFYLSAADIAPWFFTPAAWISGSIGLFLYWWVALVYVVDALRALGANGVASQPGVPDR